MHTERRHAMSRGALRPIPMRRRHRRAEYGRAGSAGATVKRHEWRPLDFTGGA